MAFLLPGYDHLAMKTSANRQFLVFLAKKIELEKNEKVPEFAIIVYHRSNQYAHFVAPITIESAIDYEVEADRLFIVTFDNRLILSPLVKMKNSENKMFRINEFVTIKCTKTVEKPDL